MAFGVGFPEIILIGAIVILLFLPKRIGGVIGGVGQAIRDFKRGKDGTK